MIDLFFLNIKPKLSKTNLNIIFDGDSLTLGSGGSEGQYFPNYVKDWLTPRVNSITFNSFGVSGQTTQQMLSDLSSQILSLYDSNKTNLIIAYEDVNAILNSARTAQQNHDDFDNYFSQCKTTGFEYSILITGAYPRVPYNQAGWNQGDPTPLDIQHDYFELCSVNKPNCNYVVDLRNDSIIGGGRGLDVNATYNDDSVHFTDLGYDLLGDNVIKGILKLFSL